jgi:Protein of unknown function (DUF3489)
MDVVGLQRAAPKRSYNEMKSFCIDANEQIQVEHTAGSRLKKGARHFTSEQEWTRIAGDLPMARLIAIWNRLPGVSPVARFNSRAKALKRIWKVIAGLEPNAGVPAAESDHAVNSRTMNEQSLRAPRGSKRDSKKAQMTALLKREQGVSIDQLVQITGWQKHSVRGFLSGTMRKKLGMKIVSAKNERGARVYRIAG